IFHPLVKKVPLVGNNFLPLEPHDMILWQSCSVQLEDEILLSKLKQFILEKKALELEGAKELKGLTDAKELVDAQVSFNNGKAAPCGFIFNPLSLREHCGRSISQHSLSDTALPAELLTFLSFKNKCSFCQRAYLEE